MLALHFLFYVDTIPIQSPVVYTETHANNDGMQQHEGAVQGNWNNARCQSAHGAEREHCSLAVSPTVSPTSAGQLIAHAVVFYVEDYHGEMTFNLNSEALRL